MAPVDQEKLKALQARAPVTRVGGKRVMKPKTTKKVAVEDKKVKAVMSKVGGRDVAGIEEINMFKKDGTVLHFKQPKLQAGLQSNAFAITGIPETKQLSDMLPDAFTQVGLEGLEHLKDIYGQSIQIAGNDESAPELIPL